MSLRRTIGQLPIRLVTGAFILNSGISKRSAGEEMAKGLHGMAIQAFPFLGKLQPAKFTQLLSTTEIALGAALLAPVVPDWFAGLGLTAFSGGLLGLYLRVPGMREEGSVRPTMDGIALAKDIWMLGIGLSLVLDGLMEARSTES